MSAHNATSNSCSSSSEFEAPPSQEDFDVKFNMKSLLDDYIKAEQYILPRTYLLGKEAVSVAFSSNMSYIIGALKSGNLWIYDIKEAADYILTYNSNYVGKIRCTQLSDDGKFLYGGTNQGFIKIWNLENNKIDPVDIDLRNGAITSISPSYDGIHYFIGHRTGIISQWNLKEQKFASEITEQQSSINCLLITHNKKYLISAGRDKEIKIWNTKDLILNAVLDDHEEPIYCLEISHDDKLLFSGGEDRTIIVWNFQAKAPKFRLVGHVSRIINLKLTSDSQFLFSTGLDKTIRVWNIQSTSVIESAVFASNEINVKGLALAQDNSVIVSASKVGVRIWTLNQTDVDKNENNNHESKILSIFQQNKKHAESVSADQIKRWRFSSHKKGENFNIQKHALCSAHSLDGDEIALGYSNGDVLIYSYINKTYELRERIEAQNSPISSIIFNSEILASGSHSGNISFCRLKSSSKIVLSLHKASITSLILFNNNTLLLSASEDKKLCSWHIETGNGNLFPVIHKDRILSLAITNDEIYAVTGSADNSVILWNINERKNVATLLGHSMDVNSVMTYANKFIISGGLDKLVCIWSIKDQILLSNIHVESSINCMAYSRLKTEIFIGSIDGEIYSIKNPLNTQTPMHVCPYKYSTLFLLFIKSALDKDVECFDAYWKDYVFYPMRTSVLNIFCHEKNANLLLEAIKSGAKYFENVNSEHPLLIAHHKRNRQCTEFIIKSLPKYLLINSPKIYLYIEPMLKKLNKTSVESLSIVYEHAYPQVTGKNLPEWGIIKGKSPNLMKSLTGEIDPAIFLTSKAVINAQKKTKKKIDIVMWDKEDDEFQWDEQDIAFYSSKVKLPLSLGKKESITFLKSLILCKNEEIFTTHLIKGIIEYKWRRAIWIIFLQFILFLINVILQLSLVFESSRNGYVQGALFIATAIFMFREMLLFSASPRYYIRVIWNGLEIIKIATIYTYLALASWSDDRYATNRVLLPLSIMITWIRGFGYFRMFKKTRVLMRLVFEVIKDMGPFSLVILTSSVVFGVVFYDVKLLPNFGDNLAKAYVVAYGEFNLDASYNRWQDLMYIIASLLNTLVLLSLIISLMGDTYDRVSGGIDIAETKEFATLILETETLLFWKRKNISPSAYLHECSLEREAEGSDQWKGKINAIRKQVKITENCCDEALKDISSFNKYFQEFPKLIGGKVAKLIKKNSIEEDKSKEEEYFTVALAQIQKKIAQLEEAKNDISVIKKDMGGLKNKITKAASRSNTLDGENE